MTETLLPDILQKRISPAPPATRDDYRIRRIVELRRSRRNSGGNVRTVSIPGSRRRVVPVFKAQIADRHGALGRIRNWLERRRTLAEAERFEREFLIHAINWKCDRGPTSSPDELAMHRAYQRIIGMGPLVIPYIRRALSDSPDHWFWALEILTGTNPVPVEAEGDINKMAEAWIDWGRKHGYSGLDAARS